MTAPGSHRPARPTPWIDARFVAGIVLIAVSIGGVWLVVAAARQTAPALAAARTIVAGEPVDRSDLRVVDVALGQLAGAYATTGDVDGGVIATRTIPAGELVPVGALGDPARGRTTSVVVRSAVDVPTAVDAGTPVEVWAAPQRERGVYDPPRILVADATVASVDRDDSMMGGGTASLELVIPRADVAAILAAISDSSAISVVPTTGAPR